MIDEKDGEFTQIDTSTSKKLSPRVQRILYRPRDRDREKRGLPRSLFLAQRSANVKCKYVCKKARFTFSPASMIARLAGVRAAAHARGRRRGYGGHSTLRGTQQRHGNIHGNSELPRSEYRTGGKGRRRSDSNGGDGGGGGANWFGGIHPCLCRSDAPPHAALAPRRRSAPLAAASLPSPPLRSPPPACSPVACVQR
jgi:hypothetical protein